MNANGLTKKILFSSNKELISYITNNYLCEGFNDFNELKKKEKELLMLEVDVIKHCLIRLESLEEIYDTSKGETSGFTLLGVFCTFVLKDYISIFVSYEKHPILFTIGQLSMFAMISYLLIFILRKTGLDSKNRSKIIYFKKLLEYVLEIKESNNTYKKRGKYKF
ncbi:hypothetical protein ACQGRZ_27205 [Bacillus wiedmannii]|uniref:hypothetical protein n=1 Tax=Bacillus wiedmannii TaxID=1890302 RepID=UPI003CE82630